MNSGENPPPSSFFLAAASKQFGPVAHTNDIFRTKTLVLQHIDGLSTIHANTFIGFCAVTTL